MVEIHTANPKANYQHYKDEIDTAISNFLGQPHYVLGETVERFERAFSDYVGVEHCIGVNSGTDALHLTLRAFEIGPGDEVITTSLTSVATVAAIEMAGATPVLADVEMPWLTIDPISVRSCITKRTRAIIPVHLYGQPADLTALQSICREYHIRLIEDCAQAHDALWHEKQIGSYGDAACFSFYPSKNLGAIGDGGAVLTSNSYLANQIGRLRQYGWDNTRISQQPGWNSRLSAIQAAVLQVKLQYLAEMTRKRGQLAMKYNLAFSDLPVTVPLTRDHARHVYHLYVLVCLNKTDRDKLQQYLLEDGVYAGIHYQLPVHLQPAYNKRVTHGSLGNTESASECVISLPIYPELKNWEQKYVINSVRGFFRGYS